MGYTIELGYADEVIEYESGWKELKDFEIASVVPFRGGSTQCLDPETPQINEELDIAPWETGGDTLDMEQYREMPLAVDDDGKVPAQIDVTVNYSGRIVEIIDEHLANALQGRTGAEGAAILMRLLTELKPEEGDTEDYWQSTDGNIKAIGDTMLAWTFQHPDARFRTY